MVRLHQLLHDPRHRLHWRALLLLLLACVSWQALKPGDGSPPMFDGIDKLQHLGAFAALALVARCGLPLHGVAGRRHGAQVAVALLVYGGAIELVQTQIPGRTASWADLAADLVGIAAGLALVAALRRAWPPRGRP